MARFAMSNAQDHSAASWIVAFLLLSYTTLTTMVRGFVKFSMLGLDDGVAVLAQLLAYGNSLSVIIALRGGLAKSSPDYGRDGNEPNYEKVSKEPLHFYSWTSARLTNIGPLRKHRILPSGISYGKDHHGPFR